MKRKYFSWKVLIIFLPLFFFSSLVAFAQTTEIKGVVKDATTSETLVGVAVSEKGTTNAILTDIDGAYVLKVPEGATVVFSYVGYEAQELKATSGQMDVSMKQSQRLLDEVVVVGYGVQRKSVVTAAISSVKANELSKVMPTRVDNVLKGLVSGVNITQVSGQPGEGARVRIRGVGSVNSSDPLYIIDGMPVSGGIDYLNPADIASVEVLKDAASAAIYGSRAANGVILVTTKQGKSAKATISYNVSYGWQNPWKKRNVLNATQYAIMMNEMVVNDGGSPIYNDPQSYGKGTDWQDEVFNYDAPVVQHQVSATGGNDKGGYFLSFGYFNQEGIVGGNFDRSNYERYTIRTNNNYTLFDDSKQRDFVRSFKVGSNLSYSRVKSKGILTNSEFGSPLGSALMLSPMLNVYAEDPTATLNRYPNAVKDKDGKVFTVVGSLYNEITNPVANLTLPGEEGNNDKIVGNFWGELELYKNLKFRTSYGVDLAFWGTDGHRIPYYLGLTNQSDGSAAWSEMNRGFTWLIENTLSYNKLYNGHDFTLLLGQSAQSYNSKLVRGVGHDLMALDRPYIDGTLKPQLQREANGKVSPYHRLASYFGRLSYNYQGKYMAEFTVRRDGSSNFSLTNKWATFPSVSAGWNVTDEKFMQNRPDFLSTLKVRASWGKNGNQSIPGFRYEQVMQGGNNYILGTEDNLIVAPGYKPNGYANQDIMWEESEQTDLGFDSYLFNGALTFTFDWYNKKTKGMLMDMPLPAYFGDKVPLGNVGTMQNSGIELDLTYQFKVSDINFKIGTNATYLKNKLLELGNDTGWLNYESLHNTGVIARGENGMPFPYFYGYKTDGLFQTIEEVGSYTNSKGQLLQEKALPGDVRFVDTNSDGKIDDADRVYLGKGIPDWTIGFNFAADWKGFDVSMLLHTILGTDVYDATRRNDLQFANLPEYSMDRWVGPGTSNSIPRLTKINENNNWRSSDLYVKNGSFLRLRNLQFGYTLPTSITSKALIQRLRVYVDAENLLTLTSYKGFDPEISSKSPEDVGNSSENARSSGVDRGIYPQPRTISIGANITF